MKDLNSMNKDAKNKKVNTDDMFVNSRPSARRKTRANNAAKLLNDKNNIVDQ